MYELNDSSSAEFHRRRSYEKGSKCLTVKVLLYNILDHNMGIDTNLIFNIWQVNETHPLLLTSWRRKQCLFSLKTSASVTVQGRGNVFLLCL